MSDNRKIKDLFKYLEKANLGLCSRRAMACEELDYVFPIENSAEML